MTVTAIKPSHYNLIVQRIFEGQCVPFLGAGVNVSNNNYNGLPLAYEVVLHLVKGLTKRFTKEQLEELTTQANEDVRRRMVKFVSKLDDEQLRQLPESKIEEYLSQAEPLPALLKATLPDLARIALHVQVEQDFGYLMKLVQEILPDAQHQPSPLLQTLAALPFKLFVTTNYDRLLERAFPKNDDYELLVQPVTGFTDLEQAANQNRLAGTSKPIIYKIHGSFRDNGNPVGPAQNLNRLILTEEDYIQFLSVVGRDDMGVPTLVRDKLVTGTILFLGYSLQDWDFRTIHKILFQPLQGMQKNKSFAIQKDPPDFWVQYWNEKDVTILNVDLYTFAEELKEYWKDFIAQKGGKNGN
jgi:hypothetical protein